MARIKKDDLRLKSGDVIYLPWVNYPDGTGTVVGYSKKSKQKNKLSKLDRSNKAHLRLAKNYKNKKANSVEQRFYFNNLVIYHESCYERQTKGKSIMSFDNKKKLYNQIQKGLYH